MSRELASPHCPNADLDNLIAGYFFDEKILAANRTVDDIQAHGYDGRLFDWLTEVLNFEPPDGPERAWPILLQRIS